MHVYGAAQLGFMRIFCAEFAILKLRILLRKCKVIVMKLIHVLSLLLVILGGLHFALTGFGIDLLGAIFGHANLTVLYMVMGFSTIYHVMPLIKTDLHNL